MGAKRAEEVTSVQITARSDYAVRSALELAATYPQLMTIDRIVSDQDMPRKFVEAILSQLRRSGIVQTQRGCAGGYTLTRDPTQIFVGEIIRSVDGPLAEVHGVRPHELEYEGTATHVPELWVSLRSSMRVVLDTVSLAQLLAGRFPARVRRFANADDAWLPR
ncbi:Rrf2 family transcriptional regulator [Flexivirga oryzae]|uniref:Rrf2 family protein n=1 Tax=Flexivirga oryzae TaxID=1794944 RepID=A0A839NIZ3_9MICO|nr:Rrf2 family protein [Flexivirga oryzae]